MRGRSVAGPIILIAVGGLFLLNNLHPEFSVWQSLGNYWPFLLIGFGVLRLIEVLADAGRGVPLPRRGVSGGFLALLIVLCVVGWAASRNARFGPFGRFETGRLEFFGEQYNFPVTNKQSAAGVTRVVLDNIRGSLTVTGQDSEQFEADGHKVVQAFNKSDAENADRETQVRFRREGNQLVIRTDESRSGSRTRRVSVDLDLKVPKGVSIEARGRSGDLTISSIQGNVDISSDRGDVRLSDIGGNARVDLNRSGLIRAVDLKGALELQGRGNDVQLENVQGQVSINGSYSGTLEFKNLAKPLRFVSPQTDLRVAQLPGSMTVDLGDIRGNHLVGPVVLRTKSRDIHIEDFSEAMELDVERGDIELTPGKMPLSKIDVHSRNGNIDLSLPERASFDLKANTAQGEVHNDFGPEVKSDIEGRSASLRSVDGKGPSITITTDRGSVSVKKS